MLEIFYYGFSKLSNFGKMVKIAISKHFWCANNSLNVRSLIFIMKYIDETKIYRPGLLHIVSHMTCIFFYFQTVSNNFVKSMLLRKIKDK